MPEQTKYDFFSPCGLPVEPGSTTNMGTSFLGPPQNKLELLERVVIQSTMA